MITLAPSLEEVDVKPCRRIESAHHARCLDAIEAAMAHEAANVHECVARLDRALATGGLACSGKFSTCISIVSNVAC